MAGLALVLVLLALCGIWCAAEIIRHTPIEPAEPSWLDTYSAHDAQADHSRPKRH